MAAEKTGHKLPTLSELHETNLQVAYKQDRLLLLLSSPANKAWIKKHPYVSVKNDKLQTVKLEYIPVDKLEFLLNKIYGFWHVEILREGQMFNSCFVVVRLHILNPVTEQWEFRDGIGAVGMQTDSGATAGNLGAIKNDAVMKGLPSAATYAFKNACKKLGAIFGGDLNNFDVEEYAPTYGPPPDMERDASPGPGPDKRDMVTAADIRAELAEEDMRDSLLQSNPAATAPSIQF